MRSNLPKVLVCCPTSIDKDYCFVDWIENVSNFTYPNFSVFLADNSRGGGYSKAIKKYVKDNYVMDFNCKHLEYEGNRPNLMQRIADSHELCRVTAKKGKFDYILHLESDVFPEHSVIEKLLWHNKDVVGSLYYTSFGNDRKLVVQELIPLTPNPEDIVSINLEPYEDLRFIDGSVKQVGHVGLGCVLISANVLHGVHFRVDKNYPNHSADSFFANDCYDKGIKIYADTSLIAKHENKKWS